MQPAAKRTAAVGLSSAHVDGPLSNGSYAAQTLGTPTAWQVLSIVSQARPDIFSGIFSANRAGRDWVLTTAPHARLTLKPPADTQPQPPFHTQLAAVKAALALRGQLPTSLTVLAEEKAVFEFIAGTLASPNITALTVEYERDWSLTDPSRITAFLLQAAFAFPALASITLEKCWGVLPPRAPPYAWPLSTLSITRKDKYAPLHHPQAHALCLSLAPYLPTLTTLHLNTPIHCLCQRYVWPVLFDPMYKATNLTTFTTTDELSDLLCGLLLSEAPALKRLGVGHVGCTGVFSSLAWGVETLCIGGEWDGIECFEHLPGTRAGKYRVEWVREDEDKKVEVRIEVDNEQGINPALARRFSEFEFMCDKFSVVPAETLPTARHPTALTHVLTQLQHLCAPQAKVPWQGWHWTHTLTQTLATGLAALPHLRLGTLTIGPQEGVTDEWLEPLIQLGRCGVKPAIVGTPGPTFESDQHRGVDWPWRKIKIRCLSLKSLLNMPHPRTAKGDEKPTVCFCAMDFTGVTLDDIATLQDYIQHINLYITHYSDHVTIQINSNDPETAAAQLSILQHITWWHNGAPWHLTIALNAPLTHQVMTALQTIPTWSSTADIDFRNCTLSLKPVDAYTQLARHVPLWLKTWRFDVTRRSKVLKCILDGIESYRESKGLKERLRVSLEEYQHEGMGGNVGKHVKLVYW